MSILSICKFGPSLPATENPALVATNGQLRKNAILWLFATEIPPKATITDVSTAVEQFGKVCSVKFVVPCAADHKIVGSSLSTLILLLAVLALIIAALQIGCI
jgi:hypothetical protein